MACEFSGVVRDAFTAAGHVAYSCDLLVSESPGLHHVGDVRDLLDGYAPVFFQAECDPEGNGWCSKTDEDPAECGCFGPTHDGMEYVERSGVLLARPKESPKWDLMIAHPPCTYLSSSGLHWNKRVPGRQAKTDQAVQFVQDLLSAPISRIAIENPVGRISTAIRPPDQFIHPHEFGHDASKRTGLWLKGLPNLIGTKNISPRFVDGRARWANQTDSGQNRLGPSADRWKKRSETYEGIAAAMATQWGGLK